MIEIVIVGYLLISSLVVAGVAIVDTENEYMEYITGWFSNTMLLSLVIVIVMSVIFNNS